MKIMEKREFFELQAIVSATSINEDNIDIEFDGINLYNEDEDEEIKIRNRRTVFDIDRCSEGLKINIFILNEGNDLKSRIDYLIDEDFDVKDVLIKVKHKRTKKEYPIRINDLIGEQVTKEVPIELPPELETSTEFILDNLTEGNQSLNSLIFETIRKSKSLQKTIETIVGVEI